MTPNFPKHSLISGGSSGIGLSLARLLVARGEDVTLIARNEARLNSAAEELTKLKKHNTQQIFTIPVDVRDKNAIQLAASEAIEKLGPLNYVIMSAGVVHPGYFEDLDSDDYHADMDTNYFGSLYIVKAVYPALKEQQSGRLLFISSGAGLMGIFGYSAYSPSKFAVKGLAEALRSEFKSNNIQVSIAYPADTDTPQYQAEIKIRPSETSIIAGSAKLWPSDQMAAAILAKADKGAFQIAPGFALGSLLKLNSFIAPFLNKWFDFLIKKNSRR